jgi:AraC-like DNA-binding protein
VALPAVAVAGHSSYTAAFDGARAGVAALIMASPRFDLYVLVGALQEAGEALLASRMWDILGSAISRPISDETETLLRRTRALSHSPVSLSQLAGVCRLHECSLRRYCTRHALPEPQRLIAHARLLRAAMLLDDGIAPDAVCSHLGFASIDALRKVASRTVQASIRQWPRGEAARTVAARFARALSSEAEAPERRLVVLA